MHLFCQLLFTAFFLGTVASAPNQAPWKSWTFCKKQDPNKNNECLLKAVKAVENDLLPGNAYFGTPPLDPLHIEELSMYQAGRDTAVAVNITFKDCDIIGLRQWELVDMRADWDAGKLSAKIKINGPVEFISQYNINGKIILLPISGNGKSNITFLDMDVDIKATLKPYEKKSKKYFQIVTYDTLLLPKGLKVNLENLFNGNKALSDNMNKILNENAQEILKEVMKPVSDGLSAAFKQIAFRVFSKIPIDQLIPE